MSEVFGYMQTFGFKLISLDKLSHSENKGCLKEADMSGLLDKSNCLDSRDCNCL